MLWRHMMLQVNKQSVLKKREGEPMRLESAAYVFAKVRMHEITDQNYAEMEKHPK